MTDRRRTRLVGVAAVVAFSALVALGAGVGGVTAADPSGIDSCAIVDDSGSYELDGTITADSTGSCIQVTASDVTIEGNGHAIVGYDTNTVSGGGPEYINGSTGIHVTGTLGAHVENVTVRNVTLQDGNVGVNASYATDLTLENVDVRRTDTEAIVTSQTDGTVALRDVSVEDSASYDNPLEDDYDAPVRIGESKTASDKIYPENVVASNLSISDSGYRNEMGDASLDVDSAGPVTITDGTVTNANHTGINVITQDIAPADEDVTIENVTVDGFGAVDTGTGIFVNSDESVVVERSQVFNGAQVPSDHDTNGFWIAADDGATFANNTVRNIDGTGVSLTGATTIRDVTVENTGNGSGLTAEGGGTLTARNVTVSNAADDEGWGASIYGSDETVVREVRVTDTGYGGLRVGRDFAGSVDVRNVTVADVRNVYDPSSSAAGGGLGVIGTDGLVRNVSVSDTEGGVRLREEGEEYVDEALSVGNLTVQNASHIGVDVRGDNVTLADSRVANTSMAGIVKRPEESAADDADDSGRFVARNVSVTDTGAAGFTTRYGYADDNGPNDRVTLTNVTVTNAAGDGVTLPIVRTATLEGVDVASAAGTDLNLTNASATLEDVTLSSTRIDGDAQDVTVEAIAGSDVADVPDGTFDVDTFLEATDTARDGYLNATVHYGDGDVPGDVDESTLAFWRSDGSRWSAIGGTSDPSSNTVSKNLTYFSTFALLGTDGTRSTAANFTVDIADTDGPVWDGVPLTVTADVTNQRTAQDTQDVELLDFDGTVVDSESVTLDGGASTSITLEWTPTIATPQTREIAVRSEYGWDTAPVELSPISGESILGCAELTEPGSYELARDISFDGDRACIEVRSDDVHIDGQGYTVTGPQERGDSDEGIGVRLDVENGATANVTVNDVVVRNVSTVAEMAVPADDALSNVTLRNVSAPFVGDAGLDVGVDDGSTLDGLAVHDSDFTGPGDGIAIDAGEPDATVRDVNVSNVTIDTGGSTRRGIEVDLGDHRATLDGFDVTNSAIHTGDEAVIVDKDAYGDDVVVRNVTVTNNDLNSTTDAVLAVNYVGRDTMLDTVRIEDNRIRSEAGDGSGIVLNGAGDSTKTRDVVVSGNDLASVDDGVSVDVESYAAVTNLEIGNNSVAADYYAISVDATDGSSSPSIDDLDVRNNTVSAGNTGVRLWISGSGVTSGAVDVADNRVSDVTLGLDVLVGAADSTHEGTAILNNTVTGTDEGAAITFFGDDVAYDATVGENAISDFSTAGIVLDAQTDPGADLELAENDIRNESGAVTGLAVRTSSSNATGNGTLAATRNTVRTGGDAVVVNEDDPGGGPVDSLDLSYNVFDAPGFGVANHNAASDGQGRSWVNATRNYWNASDGPGSAAGLVDPVTGAAATGSGSTVSAGDDASAANVRFDPHLPSATPEAFFVHIDGTNAPVTEGEALSVAATVENAGDETATRTVALSVNGTERNSTDVTLAGDESTSIGLNWPTGAGDAGAYAATVSTENDSDTIPVTIDPTEGSAGPTASFEHSPTNPEAGTDVTFDATASADPDGSVVSYEWDVDGDGTYEATGRTHAHAFASSGAYSVTLRVTDDDGNTDARTRTVTVADGQEPPSAAFDHSPSAPAVGDSVSFDGSISTDPDGSIVSYEWDIDGDGTYEGSGETISYTYATAGTYTAGLRVTDDDGNIDLVADQVIVSEQQPPVASFDYAPAEPNPTESIAFDASNSTDPDGTVASYDWDFDGDGTFETSGETVSHSYPSNGTYAATLRVTDDAGATSTTSEQVAVADRREPTVALTAIGPANETVAPADGLTVDTNDTLTVEIAADGTPGAVDQVVATLASTTANFRHEIEATHRGGDTWAETVDLSGLPDDGRYAVVLTATDAAGNRNVTATNVTVGLDRTGPQLGATVSRLDDATASVTVTASEPLAGSPTIDVEKPDGTAETVTIAESSRRSWNGTFDLSPDGGQYNVTLSGTDPAGNAGTGTVRTYVDTVETENGASTVVLDPSGLFVTVATNESVSDTVVLTESTAPTVPLGADQAGAGFLDGHLGETLAGNLSRAEIGLPVTGSPAAPDDVSIRYYNETTGGWELRETAVENRTVGGTTRAYWVTTVSHFSTYGAIATDVSAPSLDDAAPASELTPDTTNETFRFEYGDDISGVNASTVSLSFAGAGDVTDDPATSITSRYATYRATGLESGSYTATVTLADAAGNAESYDTTFTVPSDGGGGGLPPAPPAPTDPGSVELTSLSDPGSIDPGETIRLTVTLTNPGSNDVADTVAFAVDGEPVASEPVDLAAGAEDTVTVAIEAPDEPGAYDLTVATAADSRDATLAVSADGGSDEPDDADPGEGSDDSAADDDADGSPVPGFGLGPALLALCFLVGIAVRARDPAER